MADLIRATERLDAAAYDSAVPGTHPHDERRRQAGRKAQPDAARFRTRSERAVDHVDRLHAMMQHGAVLADVEEAAVSARLSAIVAAARDILGEPARHDTYETNQAITERVEQRKRQIDAVLSAQRQLTRDALQELLPEVVPDGRHTANWVMTGLEGLHDHALDAARTHLAGARAHYAELEKRRRQPRGPLAFGAEDKPRPSTEEVETARSVFLRAQQEHDDLYTSLPHTVRATRALDAVMDLEPSADAGTGVAARAGRIARQSRARAKTDPGPPAARPPRFLATETGQGAHHQVPGAGQRVQHP
jgi:hypothetical protein